MNKINGNFSGIPGVALLSAVTRSNWNFEILFHVEGGKSEYREKNPRSKDENQQQTQPIYDAETENRTRAILVGDECSHHCAIPSPPAGSECIFLPTCALLSFHDPNWSWSLFAIFNNSSGSYNNLLNREHGLSCIN